MSLTPEGSPVVEAAAGIEHIDGLFSYALVLTRNRSEAEDLVQETYVRAIRAMGSLRTGSNVIDAQQKLFRWMERRTLWILQRLQRILMRSM